MTSMSAQYQDTARAPPGSPAERKLRALWEAVPGWRGWLSTVDHKTIGLRYLVTAFFFLLLGGTEALVMRLQLARPNETLLTPEQYAQFFTMHGITMIFLYALPILSGFSNYLWPLLLGSRDMAFPRLNALSYWIFLFAGIFMYMSFPLGQAPDDGWFNYVPFSGPIYNTGPNIDVYAMGMVLLGISTVAGAVNFVVTLFTLRAPGMSLGRIPILVWGTLTASVANLLAVPAVSLAFMLLWLDRNLDTHFFDTANGGRPLLWEHMFWMFGHPWVYVVVLPAMGIVSDALPAFCRRPLVGYAGVALSTIATMLIGFEVWVHHMFTTGLPTVELSFFGAASMLISVPSAVAVFAWIATIWLGRPVFKTPFLFFAGFVLLFVMGGVSGVMTAAVPLDLQLNDTYFVVAHLHYVLLGINVFPVIGGLYYWFPKFTGRMTSERLGRWAFWVMFTGFNLGFFPMHIAGLLGMPRRIYTYPADMGWNTVNMVTSAGSFLFAFGILIFMIDIAMSLRRGRACGPNPWDAPTLEWSVPSPPPPYNFAVIPTVGSRHPLWESWLNEGAERSRLDTGPLLDDGRQTLGTSALEAAPLHVLQMPGDSYAPLVLAAFSALFFGAMLLHAWFWAGAMAVGCVISVIAWLWPEGAEKPSGARWGMWALIATEASLFGYLLFAYTYLRLQTHQHWPPEEKPDLLFPGLNTALLLVSSLGVHCAERSLEKAKKKQGLFFLAAAIALGAAFAGVQAREWMHKPYGPSSHLYGSLYFTITGFHMLHVVAGLVMLTVLGIWISRDGQRREALVIGALYWHFVDAVWLVIFSMLFLAPYL